VVGGAEKYKNKKEGGSPKGTDYLPLYYKLKLNLTKGVFMGNLVNQNNL
jgi:hypothetical protein